MPFYLKERDVLSQVAGLKSVLIVPCRFCPATTMAVKHNKPYIDLFRNVLRTEAYEFFIKDLKRRLENEGISTAVFDNKLLHQFVTCMWTSGRREKLAKRAAEFDGIVVLGCDSAVRTVRDAVRSTDYPVIRGMEVVGIMDVVPKVSFPFKVSLKLKGVTSVSRGVQTDTKQE